MRSSVATADCSLHAKTLMDSRPPSPQWWSIHRVAAKALVACSSREPRSSSPRMALATSTCGRMMRSLSTSRAGTPSVTRSRCSALRSCRSAQLRSTNSRLSSPRRPQPRATALATLVAEQAADLPTRPASVQIRRGSRSVCASWRRQRRFRWSCLRLQCSKPFRTIWVAQE